MLVVDVAVVQSLKAINICRAGHVFSDRSWIQIQNTDIAVEDALTVAGVLFVTG